MKTELMIIEVEQSETIAPRTPTRKLDRSAAAPRPVRARHSSAKFDWVDAVLLSAMLVIGSATAAFALAKP